ncbi:Uncharacterized protein FWK35_00021647, partial [Aphis craccivora]
MPPKLDTPIKPVSKATSIHHSETVNKASPSTDSISNADIMAVLTKFKSDVLASNKSLSDLHATQYKDLKSDLADVFSQMNEMRKENVRIQNEIDFLKDKVATLENSNAAVGSDLVVSQVVEETIERDKCRYNFIIYGVTESTFGAIPQRISYDRSTIIDILKPLGDVIPLNTKLVSLEKVPSDSARPKIIFDSNEAATNLLSNFNALKQWDTQNNIGNFKKPGCLASSSCQSYLAVDILEINKSTSSSSPHVLPSGLHDHNNLKHNFIFCCKVNSSLKSFLSEFNNFKIKFNTKNQCSSSKLELNTSNNCLKFDISDAELGLLGYTILRCDRCKDTSDKLRGGGTLIAIKNKFQPTFIIPRCVNVEQLFVSISLGKTSILIASVYLPPGSETVKYESSHTMSMDHIWQSNNFDLGIACGDFNLPNVIWTNIISGLEYCGQITDKVRLLGDQYSLLHWEQKNNVPNANGSLLDLVFSSNSAAQVYLSPDTLIPSDLHHPLLSITCPYLPAMPIRDPLHMYRDFKKADYENILKDLVSTKWDDLNLNANEVANLLQKLLLDTILKWLSHNPKLFWQHVRNLQGGPLIPKEVHLGDLKASGDQAANLFATYFSSVYSKPRTFSNSHLNLYVANEFLFLPSKISVTINEVHTALESLQSTRGSGPDGIAAPFLYHCKDILALPICLIFNKSLIEGSFPSIWKISRVTPILKSGNLADVKNYRPISGLLFLVDQHGFFPGRSTITSAVDFTSYVYESFERKQQVDVIYTDFSKAFDSIDHGILINTLDRLGVGEPLLSWQTSYLHDRYQFINLFHTTFKNYRVLSGVPQGSHLDDAKIFYSISAIEDCVILPNVLDKFTNWLKDLGFTYVPSLNFRPHIDSVAGKALRVLGFIRRHFSNFDNPKCLSVLYNSHIRSLLEYGVVIWAPYTMSNMLRLDRVQNRFLSSQDTASMLHTLLMSHDYSKINDLFKFKSLSEPHIIYSCCFLPSLIDGKIDAPRLLERLSICIP